MRRHIFPRYISIYLEEVLPSLLLLQGEPAPIPDGSRARPGPTVLGRAGPPLIFRGSAAGPGTGPVGPETPETRVSGRILVVCGNDEYPSTLVLFRKSPLCLALTTVCKRTPSGVGFTVSVLRPQLSGVQELEFKGSVWVSFRSCSFVPVCS